MNQMTQRGVEGRELGLEKGTAQAAARVLGRCPSLNPSLRPQSITPPQGTCMDS